MMSSEWHEISNAPCNVRLLTWREGEKDVTISWRLGGEDGTEQEWVAEDGRTTVTHHTYLPPTHWCFLPAPPIVAAVSEERFDPTKPFTTRDGLKVRQFTKTWDGYEGFVGTTFFTWNHAGRRWDRGKRSLFDLINS